MEGSSVAAPPPKLRLRPRPTPDPSVLRPSIGISVTGMKQAVACLENGTPEIRSYLLEECNLIYECKTCFNLFRSLANLIAHKRSYCDSRAKNVCHVREDSLEPNGDSYTTMAYVEPEPVETLVPEAHWDLQDYSPSLTLLQEAGFLEEIQRTPLVKKLKPDLNTIIRELKKKKTNKDSIPSPKKKIVSPKIVLKEPIIRLERITQSTCAVFQTVSHSKAEASGKTMGQLYVEVEKLQQHPTVMAGPDGKVVHPDKQGPPYKDTVAKESLKENLKSKLRYHCLFCDHTYGNIHTVIVHIHKAHGKTMKQAQDYRSSIRKTSHALDTSKAQTLPKKKRHRSINSKSEAPSKSKRSKSHFVDTKSTSLLPSLKSQSKPSNLKTLNTGSKKDSSVRLDQKQSLNSNKNELSSDDDDEVILNVRQPNHSKAVMCSIEDSEPQKQPSKTGRGLKAKAVPKQRPKKKNGATTKLAVKFSFPIRTQNKKEEMNCDLCHRRFHTIFGWRRHQRTCRNSSVDRITNESVVDILKNQPVIVLNKLDSSNLPLSSVSGQDHSVFKSNKLLSPPPKFGVNSVAKIISLLSTNY